MTRLLMVVIGTLSFGALWAAGDASGIWLALTSLVQALFIWALSFKRGIGGRDRLDIICLVLCLMGAVLWLVSGQSLLGLILSIVADIIACVPSLLKTVRLPHTESVWFYVLDTIAGGCIVFASAHTQAAMLFPVYIVLANGVFVAVIWWPRKRRVPAAQDDLLAE
jgi:hypothetical protein